MEIVLKNGQIIPSQLEIIRQRDEQTSEYQNFVFTIKVMKSHGSYSEIYRGRKYIFAIEELQQQETDFIQQGDNCQISWISQPGTYHLFCVNYPKLECTIIAKNSADFQDRQRVSATRISLSNLEAVEEQREDKQQELKDEQKIQIANIQKDTLVQNQKCEALSENQWVKDDQSFNESPFGTPKKADLSDFDRILSSVNDSSENTQNKYLRYFQEEFKLWRNFFEEKKEESNHSDKQEVSSLFKQKPKSERRKNSGNDRKNQIKQENWSKRQNFSPTDLEFGESCGSPSYNENMSQYQKQKSVGSYLYSCREMHDRGDEELQDKTHTMKKTNSEYRLAVQDIFEQKQTLPDSDKKRNSPIKEGKKPENLLDWVDGWCEQKKKIQVSCKDDSYIVNQWLAYLKNRFKLSQFIHQ